MMNDNVNFIFNYRSLFFQHVMIPYAFFSVNNKSKIYVHEQKTFFENFYITNTHVKQWQYSVYSMRPYFALFLDNHDVN